MYKVALKGFISESKDGYECFRDGIIEFLYDSESGEKIHDIVFHFFQSFKADYHTKNKDHKREKRMKLFNTNEKNICENGFMKITAPLDKRIINI